MVQLELQQGVGEMTWDTNRLVGLIGHLVCPSR